VEEVLNGGTEEIAEKGKWGNFLKGKLVVWEFLVFLITDCIPLDNQ
jgi:hypothetical protein